MRVRWGWWLAPSALWLGLGCAAGGVPPVTTEASDDESSPTPMVTMATRARISTTDAGSLGPACGSAELEISGGGTYAGSTCDCADTRDLACNSGTHPEARFRFTVPAEAWGCKVVLGAGLAYEYSGEGIPTTCGGDTGAVDMSLPVAGQPGILFGGGASGHVYQFAVETFGEDCGGYTFTVHCGDETDLI